MSGDLRSQCGDTKVAGAIAQIRCNPGGETVECQERNVTDERIRIKSYSTALRSGRDDKRRVIVER